MSKLKEFLSVIEKKDKAQYFRLYKFYIDPKSSLGGNNESTIDNYYEYGDIKYFVLNNIFFEFLELCLQEENFVQKLDLNLLRKIRFILFDSRDFKEEYFEDFEDKYLRDFCKGEVPLGPIYCKKYNNLQLLGLVNKYKQFGWIYELEIGKEKLKNLDIELINKLIFENTMQTEFYQEKYIKPLEERESALNRIKKDNYSQVNNCLLYRPATDKKIFLNLVCDNDFLKIIEEELLLMDLPNIIINNIIEILEVSINFKTLNKIYSDFDFHYNQLGQKVKKFDLNKARELISQFKNKKNKKIIRL